MLAITVTGRGGEIWAEAHRNGERVGWLSVEDGVVAGVYVLESARRQGVATALWFELKRRGFDVEHSVDRSPEGDAWARAVGGAVPPLVYSNGVLV